MRADRRAGLGPDRRRGRGRDHLGEQGPTEVARHARSTPGRPQLSDEHDPPRPPGALERQPRPRRAEEAAFLALGEGAAQWLLEAAAAGTSRVRAKMAEAVTLAKLHEVSAVDQALGTVALAGRFDDGDLAAILDHQRHRAGGPARRATEAHSLQPGTAAWAQLGGEPGSQR